MEQVFITIFGSLALWLSQDKRYQWRKWSPVFGMIGQPFWYYSSYIHQQWGIMVLSVIYTFCWLKGINTYWRGK